MTKEGNCFTDLFATAVNTALNAGYYFAGFLVENNRSIIFCGCCKYPKPPCNNPLHPFQQLCMEKVTPFPLQKTLPRIIWQPIIGIAFTKAS